MRKHRLSTEFLTLTEFEQGIATIPKPMAVFVAFDLLATNVLKICQNAGLSIPQDTTILGVDNDEFLEGLGEFAHVMHPTRPASEQLRRPIPARGSPDASPVCGGLSPEGEKAQIRQLAGEPGGEALALENGDPAQHLGLGDRPLGPA